ncbi:hypothetical protein CDAR_412211 [Caerostris darwini]|uniref:Uncharacterized protein n=1 Tax=Caerostris darwini TaxID=1538125 RepID=A0AAV4WDJ2_9ARAC|nr:hypothetical protein CDAR_412211 [Caerostris darwini]
MKVIHEEGLEMQRLDSEHGQTKLTFRVVLVQQAKSKLANDLCNIVKQSSGQNDRKFGEGLPTIKKVTMICLSDSSWKRATVVSAEVGHAGATAMQITFFLSMERLVMPIPLRELHRLLDTTQCMWRTGRRAARWLDLPDYGQRELRMSQMAAAICKETGRCGSHSQIITTRKMSVIASTPRNENFNWAHVCRHLH